MLINEDLSTILESVAFSKGRVERKMENRTSSDRSREVLEAVLQFHEAKEKATKAVSGFTMVDFEYGLRDGAFDKASSADIVLSVLKHDPSITTLNVNRAFEILPERAKAKFKSPKCMTAAIRVLRQLGVLKLANSSGEWIVDRSLIS
jgi:hypothetical protein